LPMTQSAYSVKMEIAGNTAMWTRPDTGDCPVSYPAPTYSAVKAIFESILWGPDVEIIPLKTELCAPIQYHSYGTNYGGPLRSSTSIRNGNNYQLFATVLIDVCYKLYAEVVPYKNKSRLPKDALQWDGKTTSPGHAYQDIFERRLKRGQCYSIPFLGWREFTTSYFGEFRETTLVLSDMPVVIIPSMLRQVFSDGYNSSQASYAYDNHLVVQNGVLKYS
jgi:CRISPR-associated protein Cas5d